MTIKGIKITQSDCNELWRIGKTISYNEIAYTINSNCIKVLEKLKFITKPNGIGWEVKRK